MYGLNILSRILYNDGSCSSGSCGRGGSNYAACWLGIVVSWIRRLAVKKLNNTKFGYEF